MIVVPPQPPVPPEQVIEQRLVKCGLDSRGFTVKYEDDLQSIEIVINDNAGATKDRFACIRKAAGYEIVTFRNGQMQRAYSDFVTELLRPQMTKEAKAELQKRGLLRNFPERASFDSVTAYAKALEAQCGLAPGSVLRPDTSGITFQPPADDLNPQQWVEKYSCIFAVMNYASAKGDAEFGFIGNEMPRTEKQ
jgi:hypothetical protein